MSLHHLAAHIQSQGRKGDTGLIHMSPGEIGALQKLAVAHGGSLTINPETGLPEANFMRDWLPAIVGGLAMFIPGVGPMASMALAAGGAFGTSMAVGNSFNKSLMAGLASGAGAGLGAGLGAAGAAAGAEANVLAKGVTTVASQGAKAAPGLLTQEVLQAGGVGAAESLGSRALSSTAPRAFSVEAQQLAQQGAQRGLTQEAGMLAQPGRIFAGAAPRQGVTSYTGTIGQTITPEQFGASRLPQAAQPAIYTANPVGKIPANIGPASYGAAPPSTLTGEQIFQAASPADKLSMQGKGLGTVLDSPKAALDFAGANKGKLLALGTGIVGSNLADPQGINPPPPEVSTYAGPYKPVERTAQFPIGPQPYTDTSERSYFSDINPYPGYEAYADPKKKPISAADGGLMGLAGGGYDDEAGHDGYADGGEVGARMATPDMNAIQSYVQSIGQPQQGNPNALQNYTQGLNPQQSDPNALQNYLSTLEQQRQQPTLGRPQVPDILRQMQAMPQQAPQIQTPQIQAPIAGGERDYGFKQTQAPIAGGEYDYGFEPQQVIPLQYETPPPKNVNWYTQSRAKGGMTSLARGGNYLDGPGDGLSDSIPATIGNRQPARLADGEFVISADVVSDIGGGSSKAGAKKLHAMMDRVRQSAHGTKKQVKKLDDRKVLAA